MTYDTCGHGAPAARSTVSGKLMPIACIVTVVALLAWGESKVPASAYSDNAAPLTEDWHGNVRRSHWGK